MLASSLIALGLALCACVVALLSNRKRRPELADVTNGRSRVVARTSLEVALPAGEALSLAVTVLAGMNLAHVSIDQSRSTVVAWEGVTWRSFGEQVVVTTTALDGGRSMLTCVVQPQYANTLYDWGAARRLVDAFVQDYQPRIATTESE